MQLQVQPSRWSCLPTSLAMVLGVPVKEIFDSIGHDGSEILWPELPEPNKRRAFSLQEMVMVADKYHHFLVVHDAKWYNATTENIIRFFDPPRGYFLDKLMRFSGVMTGETLTGKRHAVAWDGNCIFDPAGYTQQLSNFKAENFLACCPLKR